MVNYLILSIGRTGHHAITEWLSGQQEGGLTQYNDCFVKDELVPKNVMYDGRKNKAYILERFDFREYDKIKKHSNF